MSASALIIERLEEILRDLCEVADKEMAYQYPQRNGEIMFLLIGEINKITQDLLRRKKRMN